MDRRSTSDISRWGVRLLIGSAILIAIWAALEFAPPVEEPASPGRTENPISPWNRPLSPWEYVLAHGLVLLVDYILPTLASSAFAAGVSMVAFETASRPGMIRSVLGALLLVGGCSLLATTAWQWHVRTQPMAIEPFTTPHDIDPDSPFLPENRTPEKSEAYWKKMRRRDRLDRVWWRLVLYSFPPAGLLFGATGMLLLSARGRAPRDS